MWFIVKLGPNAYWFGNGNFGYLPLLTTSALFSASAGLMIWGLCTKGDYLKRFLSLKVLKNIGVISYGIYLWHYPIGKYASKYLLNINSNYKLIYLVVICGGIIIGWALFSYRIVEVPFLKIKKSKPLSTTEVL